MRLVNLANVKPGDELAQNIISKEGKILLKCGISLTQVYIDKLLKLGINLVYIKDKNLEDIEGVDPKFMKLKTDVMQSFSKVFSNSQYSSIKIDDTESVVKEMIDYLQENKNINSSYLTELKTHDNYTYVHSLNTSVISLYFGVKKGFNKNMLLDLGIGTILHDMGKIKVPINILNKKGKLTDKEFEEMKKHPVYGYEMLKNLKGINERAKKIVLEHHERIDGTGYPFGKTGDKISYYAKVACISDVYDALISDRVYRKGFPPHEAYEIILMNSGRMLDEELVGIFKKSFSMYPLGVEVVLNNNFKGFVVGHNEGFPDRPIVRIVKNDEGKEIIPVDVNLLEILNISIKSVVI